MFSSPTLTNFLKSKPRLLSAVALPSIGVELVLLSCSLCIAEHVQDNNVYISLKVYSCRCVWRGGIFPLSPWKQTAEGEKLLLGWHLRLVPPKSENLLEVIGVPVLDSLVLGAGEEVVRPANEANALFERERFGRANVRW